MALIFIEAFDIYYKLAHPHPTPQRSVADNQRLFVEKQAHQSLTRCGVYDTNYKRQPSVLNQLGSLTVCVCEQAGRKSENWTIKTEGGCGRIVNSKLVCGLKKFLGLYHFALD